MGKRDRIKRSPGSSSKLKLSLNELKEVVAASDASLAAANLLNDDQDHCAETDQDETSSDEDLGLKFVSVHDSCEIAKDKIKRLGPPHDSYATEDPMVHTTSQLSHYEPSIEISAFSAKNTEIQSKLEELKSRLAGSAFAPTNQGVDAIYQRNGNSQQSCKPIGPSKFENFLLEVLQSETSIQSSVKLHASEGVKVSAACNKSHRDQQKVAGNVNHALTCEPRIALSVSSPAKGECFPSPTTTSDVKACASQQPPMTTADQGSLSAAELSCFVSLETKVIDQGVISCVGSPAIVKTVGKGFFNGHGSTGGVLADHQSSPPFQEAAHLVHELSEVAGPMAILPNGFVNGDLDNAHQPLTNPLSSASSASSAAGYICGSLTSATNCFETSGGPLVQTAFSSGLGAARATIVDLTIDTKCDTYKSICAADPLIVPHVAAAPPSAPFHLHRDIGPHAHNTAYVNQPVTLDSNSLVGCHNHVPHIGSLDFVPGLDSQVPTAKRSFADLFKPAHDGVVDDLDLTPTCGYNQPCIGTHCEATAGHESVATDRNSVCESNFKLDFVNHGVREDNLVLPIPQDLSLEGKKEWSTTLVGRFLGKKLPYSLVSNATERLWANEGLIDTLATDSGCFFFSFANEGFRDAVLEGGPWFIAGQPILLRPWKPNFSFAKEGVQSIPIWVNLYGIPLEYWNPKGISFISSFIGKPIRVDRTTASRRRITFARVCIEVSAEYEFMDEFHIEAFDEESGESVRTKISLEYQWTPMRCKDCSQFGHDCSKAMSPLPAHNFHHSKKKEVAGVWQTVTKKDKGKQPGEDHSLNHDRRISLAKIAKYQTVPSVDSIVDRITIGPSMNPCQVTTPSNVAGPSSYFHVLTEDAQVSSGRGVEGLEQVVQHVEGDLDTNGPHDREAGNDNEDMVKATNNDGLDVYDYSTNSLEIPMSSRQKKKEAKMQYSGSRPKGRHRP